MIQSTSREAYEAIKPRISVSQGIVLRAFQGLGTACNLQVAAFLGWPINSVTPRVKELREKGLLKKYDKKISPSGYAAIFWQITKLPEKQMEFFR